MDMQKIYEDLQRNIPNSNIFMNEQMSKHTSFGIGGKADIYVKIKSVEDIKEVLNYADVNNITITIIGNGSNILVRDNGIRGITIQVDLQEIQLCEDDKENQINLTVGSGVKLGMLANLLQRKGISGFEFASGIPGTIGGAIRMNAGAYGSEIKDIVQDVTFIERETKNIVTLQNNDMDFSYRHSRFVNSRDVIISATLKLQKGNEEEIRKVMKEYKKSREEKQPYDKRSAGSTFKRGVDFITAKLIDEAGLKGFSIGGAKISAKHAGFIINTGDATADDVISLIQHVKKTVYNKFGKELELEVEIIGE